MPAHGRSKNGVASLAYVAGTPPFLSRKDVVDGRAGAPTPVFNELCPALTNHCCDADLKNGARAKMFCIG
jgi:hypothetical protein